jgi:hypothetical protein
VVVEENTEEVAMVVEDFKEVVAVVVALQKW